MRCDSHSSASGKIWICEEKSYDGGVFVLYMDLEASAIPFAATFESIFKSVWVLIKTLTVGRKRK